MERSGQYSLTTKAYQTGYQDTSSFRLIDTQWDYYSSDILTKGIPLVGDNKGSYTCYQVCFTGEYRNSLPLEYAFSIYDSTGNTRLYASVYYDSGSIVNVGLPYVATTDQIVYRCTLYVRRKDGASIDRTDMYAGAWTWYLNRTTEVEEETLPSDWFVDTTATVVNPVESYTTVIGTQIPWDDIQHQMDLPVAVENAVLYIYDLISQVLVMRYLTFMIVFALGCTLICWILH